MTKRPEKIKEQIAKLQADLEEAEQERVNKNHERITKAAQRTGLDHAQLTAADLEREFKQLARRMQDEQYEKSDDSSKPDESKGHDKPADKAADKAPGQAEKPSDNVTRSRSETATKPEPNKPETGDPSTLKKPADAPNQKPETGKPEQHKRGFFRNG